MWDPQGSDDRVVMTHRKMWEWLYISAALGERGMLENQRSGLGFGVGKEPLVSLFAHEGCTVVATDLDPELAQAKGWMQSGVEYAHKVTDLNAFGLCPPDLFSQRVRFAYVDMNSLPRDLGEFDFTWSSCAFEHLGSLERGEAFVLNQMRYLKPGGVAVHTTEYNVSSNTETISHGATVLYRRRDIENLARGLRRSGYEIEIDFSLGETPMDQHIDLPPFSNTHLRTRLDDYTISSIGLIIERPSRHRSRVRFFSGQRI
jgi:SAM-dependent methyltransferase